MNTYLDYAASTPVDPIVIEAMLPFLHKDFGNPSSIHRFGQRAEAAVEKAREQIASVLGCQAQEILFTSCGTESDNLAIRGTAFAEKEKRGANHLLISPVEHPAVSETAEQLAQWHGFEVEYLRVDGYGRVDPSDLATRIRPETAVVSVVMANNEIGTVNPIADLAAICRERSIPFHTDAVQAGAHLKIDVQQLGVDLLALGAHKFYGPKGVGVLFRRAGTPLMPTQTGGGQEHRMRAGTSNVPYIVGMATAFKLAQGHLEDHRKRLLPMRDRLIGTILEEIPYSRLTGHPTARTPNHASFVFHGVDGNALLISLDMHGFACSSGSACKTGSPEPSKILLALGLEPEWALGSLRVTIGKETQLAEIDRFLDLLPGLISRHRNGA